MIRVNENYQKLKASYLFADIAKRVNAWVSANPDKKLIRMGIGDVTEPLPPACIAAFHAGVDEMAKRETFKGYGPEQGYDSLRQLIAKHDFQARRPSRRRRDLRLRLLQVRHRQHPGALRQRHPRRHPGPSVPGLC